MNKSKSIILGTVQLGTIYGIKNKSNNPIMISENQANSILNCAFENGVRFFDTARDYGTAESVLGNWPLKNQVKILTKFKSAESFTHAEDIFGESLEMLGLKKIHCLSLHLYEDCLQEYNLRILDHLKRIGFIEHTGVSIYNTYEIDHIVRNTDLEIIQSPFNVFDHSGIRGESFSKAKKAGRKIHVRSIFLQGLLLMDRNTIPHHLESLKSKLLKLDQFASESNCNVRDLCINYVLNTPNIDGVIIGIDSMENLLENIYTISKSANLSIDRDKIESINIEDTRYLNPSLWGKI